MVLRLRFFSSFPDTCSLPKKEQNTTLAWRNSNALLVLYATSCEVICTAYKTKTPLNFVIAFTTFRVHVFSILRAMTVSRTRHGPSTGAVPRRPQCQWRCRVTPRSSRRLRHSLPCPKRLPARPSRRPSRRQKSLSTPLILT